MVTIRPPHTPHDPGALLSIPQGAAGARRGRWLNSAAEAVERAPVPRVFGLGRDGSVLFWTWFIWGMGAGLWAYFWPVYLNRLGADSVQVGLVVGAGGLVATLAYLPGGIVAQLGRHKWQLVVAHSLATLGVTSYALAHSWWHVIPGVLLTNLIALFGPAINSLVAQIADDEQVPVPTLFATIGAAQFATMTISPPIGGWIAAQYGMAALFPLVGLAYGTSALGMCLVRSRAMPREGLATASPRAGALAAGRKAYGEVLRSRAVLLLLLTSFLVHAGMYLAASFAPLYLRDTYGYDATAIGWAGSAASAGAALLLVAIERIRRRFGVVRAMWLSCGLIGVHFAAVISAPALAAQMAGFFFRGGIQTMSTLTTVALTDLVSRARLAAAVAVLATVAGAAAIGAPPIGGWLYALSPAGPFVAGIAVLAVAQPLVARAYRPRAAAGGQGGVAGKAARAHLEYDRAEGSQPATRQDVDTPLR
jgi:MFS family permease